MSNEGFQTHLKIKQKNRVIIILSFSDRRHSATIGSTRMQHSLQDELALDYLKLGGHLHARF